MELREYLFREEMSATKFAEIIDYSRAYVSAIAHRKAIPSKKMIKVIFKATHGQVTADDYVIKDKDNLKKK